MKVERKLPPSVEALRKTIHGLRSDPPQRNKGLKKRLEKLVGQFPRFPGHFIYIYNYSEGRVVYARGIQDVLGYPDDEADLELLLGALHPEDGPLVARLNQSALEAMGKMRNPANLHDLCLSVDYRMRKADGSYIKVLGQTAVFEVDPVSGKVHSSFSLCKDITAIKSSNTIGWEAHGFETMDFQPPEGTANRLRYQPSQRELEVLKRIAQGKGSKSIADELCISTTTVSTHRRNILRRTGLKNSAELVRHATAVGWV